MTRIAGSAAIAMMLLGATASAHVTLEVREARAGSGYKAVLRVPHGCEGSATTTVRAQIPEGLLAVKPMPKPGWDIKTVRGDYERSYPFFHGQVLKDGVKEIVWSGGRLPDEYYDEFVFSAFIAKEMPEGRVHIPVTQDCEKGQAAWHEVAVAGQSAHDLKAPAPVLTILAQHGGHAHGHGAAASKPGGKTYKAGDLTIVAPWARATPGGAKVAGGFMSITNNGKEPDRLTGGTVPFAGRFEVHEMAMDGSVMRMRELPRGLEIKPGETVELKPGGYHVMFMDLTSGLKEGQTVKGTLVFEKAGTVEVEIVVGPVGGGAPAGGHSHH